MASAKSATEVPPPVVTVLDGEGTVVWANEAWRRIGRRTAVGADRPITADYLELTRRAGGDYVDRIDAGVQEVLDVGAARFATVYPCQHADREWWFQIYATELPIPGETRCLVVRRRIPERQPTERPSPGENDPSSTARPEASDRLVSYTLGPNERATDGLLMAFDAAGIDPLEQETTLHDCLATDAIDQLVREEDDFRLTVSVWGHDVVFTPGELTIYASPSE